MEINLSRVVFLLFRQVACTWRPRTTPTLCECYFVHSCAVAPLLETVRKLQDTTRHLFAGALAMFGPLFASTLFDPFSWLVLMPNSHSHLCLSAARLWSSHEDLLYIMCPSGYCSNVPADPCCTCQPANRSRTLFRIAASSISSAQQIYGSPSQPHVHKV